MDREIICPICGTKFVGDEYEDCPYCSWGYVGIENLLEENEKEPYNTMSIKQAKENVAKGLDIWGEPLKKKYGKINK